MSHAEYRKDVDSDIGKMFEAGQRFEVVKDPQSKNEYDTQFLVVIKPPPNKFISDGCDTVSLGKFWTEPPATFFAEALNRISKFNMGVPV